MGSQDPNSSETNVRMIHGSSIPNLSLFNPNLSSETDSAAMVQLLRELGELRQTADRVNQLRQKARWLIGVTIATILAFSSLFTGSAWLLYQEQRSLRAEQQRISERVRTLEEKIYLQTKTIAERSGEISAPLGSKHSSAQVQELADDILDKLSRDEKVSSGRFNRLTTMLQRLLRETPQQSSEVERSQ